MFKRKTRQAGTKVIKRKEESSDDDVLPVTSSISAISEAIRPTSSDIGDKEESVSGELFTRKPTFIPKRNQQKMMSLSTFSTQRKKFTTPIRMNDNENSNQLTDGLDSMKESEMILNVEDMEKIKKQEKDNSDEEDMDERMKRQVEEMSRRRALAEAQKEHKDDFIPVGETRSLRSMLLKRNVSSSEENDEGSGDGEDDTLATTGYRSGEGEMKVVEEESNDSDNDEKQWEKELLKRGNTGYSVLGIRENNKNTEDMNSEYRVYSKEYVMKRMTNALNELRLNYDENIRELNRLEREEEAITKDEENEFKEKNEMENRYSYYQKQSDYFRRLSGYLTDKKEEMDEIYQAMNAIRTSYKANNDVINALYRNDDLDYLKQLDTIQSVNSTIVSIPSFATIRTTVASFYKSDLYYDPEITQARNQDRCIYVDGPDCVQNTIQNVDMGDGKEYHVIGCDCDVYLNNVMFYSYDDASATLCSQLLQENRIRMNSLFDTTALSYMSLDRVLLHFESWRSQFLQDYENAYISLSIPDLLYPILLPSLLYFDPLQLQENDNPDQPFYSSLSEFPWYRQINAFAEKSPVERDHQILSRMIQKHILSLVNDIVVLDWNPLSLRESKCLFTLLTELASLFTTVIDELRTIYVSVSKRILEATNPTLFCICNLYSVKSEDIQTDAQEILEIQICRGIRLLEVIGMMAAFMELGTPSVYIDMIVTKLSQMLGGMATTPVLIPKCKMFAFRIHSLIPNEVINAKNAIAVYL